MRTVQLMVLVTVLTACSVKHDHSQHNDFAYQANTNENSWRYVWLSPTYPDEKALKKKFSNYGNFSIVPTRLEVEGSEFTEEELTEFAHYLESEAEANLGQYKTPTEPPQENGLTVQFALSNINTPNSILATTSSLIPFGLAISYASLLTTGEHTNVTAARIEVLIRDG